MVWFMLPGGTHSLHDLAHASWMESILHCIDPEQHFITAGQALNDLPVYRVLCDMGKIYNCTHSRSGGQAASNRRRKKYLQL